MKIETKKAYLVKCWNDKIIEGEAFETIINDHGENKGFMFSNDKCQTFTFVKSYQQDKVYFDLEKAQIGAKDQINDAIKYYEKQINEYSERIKEYDRN